MISLEIFLFECLAWKTAIEVPVLKITTGCELCKSEDDTM